jgi:type II secretory pathway component GspD/PulD (secretin)
MEPSPQPPRRSRRRWFQFSLSNLMLVTLLAAVLVAWQRERLSSWVESLWHSPDQAEIDDARRPPNFVIQVVIAEMELERTAAFAGVEAALQDLIARSSQDSSGVANGQPRDKTLFGGVVLSASSEVVVALLRSLKECRRFDVLSRPQLSTIGDQPAFVQVGQRIQLIQTRSVDPQTNSQTDPWAPEQSVGLILGITPSLSVDGHVVMEIDVERSDVGS